MTNNGDDVMQIISRAEARAKGLKQYFTGNPCARGHVSTRQVSNGKCRECSRSDTKSWKQKNESHVREYNQSYRSENKERCLARAREYKRENAVRVRKKEREYADKNPGKRKAWGKAYRERLGQKLAERRRARRRESPEQRKKERAWKQENRERIREQARARYREDPGYLAAVTMRNMLYRLVRRHRLTKSAKTNELLGYSPAEFQQHIERQFAKGMSWDNYGEWHIDHIIPIAEHIRNGEADPAVINCLTNLRPMWAAENMSKGDKRTSLI